MKRVKAGCIFQTLVFSQKEDCDLSLERQLELNHEEAARYRAGLDKNHIRYRITDESEQPDGSVLLLVRKQYNEKIDVGAYFD